MVGRNYHINLVVTDLERSSDFYQRYLGFTELDLHHQMVVLQDSGGLDLVLEHGEPNPAGWHFGFRIGSSGEVAAARAELELAGVEIFGAENINGMVTFKFRDPDRYVIEIYSYD